MHHKNRFHLVLLRARSLRIPHETVINDEQHIEACMLPQVTDDHRFLTDFKFPTKTIAVIACSPLDLGRVTLSIEFYTEGSYVGKTQIGCLQLDLLPALTLDPTWPTCVEKLHRAYAVAIAATGHISLADAGDSKIRVSAAFPGHTMSSLFTLVDVGYAPQPQKEPKQKKVMPKKKKAVRKKPEKRK